MPVHRIPGDSHPIYDARMSDAHRRGMLPGAADDEEQDKRLGAGAKEETEEEQEARFRARRQKEKNRIGEIFDRTFGHWSDSRWKKLERSYFEFLK